MRFEKGVSTCGACPELRTCQIVGAIISKNPAAWENLKGYNKIKYIENPAYDWFVKIGCMQDFYIIRV